MTASPIYDGNSDTDLSFDLEPEPDPIPSPSSTKPVLNRIELDQNLIELCRYDGKPCYQKNPSHFIKYRHPKDDEGSEDVDKIEAKNESEILDEFKRKKIQDDKDHEIAMRLSQASDSEDEYNEICKKPSDAFEANNTGKSLSEALILASINPKCDNRLFVEI